MRKKQPPDSLFEILSKIKKLMSDGIENSDWNKISEASAIMFGHEQEVKDSNEPSLLMQLRKDIDDLTSRVENLEGDYKDWKVSCSSMLTPQITAVKKEDAYDFTVRKKQDVSRQNTKNKFESIQINDNEIEDDLSSVDDSVDRTPRNRKPFTLVDVVCINCNKSSKVKSVLARENYVCDRCIARRIG